MVGGDLVGTGPLGVWVWSLRLGLVWSLGLRAASAPAPGAWKTRRAPTS